jgi:hypothetical protein
MQQAHHNSHKQQNKSMPNISKHNTEEEGEGDTGETGWIHFLVIWHTIGINNLLENGCELICFEHSRRFHSVLVD